MTPECLNRNRTTMKCRKACCRKPKLEVIHNTLQKKFRSKSLDELNCRRSPKCQLGDPNICTCS